MDPRIDMLRHSFSGRPAAAVERAPGHLEAAVALLVRPRDQLELLLIRRALSDRDPWSGHVALPGGRRGPEDADLLDTARREVEEEVGVPLSRIGTFVGALDEVGPATPRLPPIVIAPFVLAVPPDTTASPDEREVQAAFWIPLQALRDESTASHILIEHDTGAMQFPAYAWGEHVIWGLTYRIIEQFLQLAPA